MGQHSVRSSGLLGMLVGGLLSGCQLELWWPPPEGGGGGDEGGGGGGATGTPEVIISSGSSGRIDVSPDVVGAWFHEGGVLLRMRDSSDCIAHVHHETPYADAGTLGVVGPSPTGGGAPISLTLEALEDRNYLAYLPPEQLLFLPNGVDRVDVRLSGLAPGFPAMPPTTLQAPSTEFVEMLLPEDAEPESIQMPLGGPLDLLWVPPSGGGVPEIVVIVEVYGQRYGAVYCTWPAESGHGQVPGLLLHAVRAKVGGPSPIVGYLNVFTGSGEARLTPTSSYFALIAAGFVSLPGQNLAFE